MSNKVKKVTRYGLIFLMFKLVFCLLIFIPGVNSYAMSIPIFKSISNLVKNDTTEIDTQSKKDSNLISVTDDGYTFEVDSAVLDKESLIIKGRISGPEFQYKAGGEYPADVEIVPKDFTENSTADGGGNKLYGSGDTFTFQVEEKYKDGEVNKFLQRGEEFLTLDVMVYRRADMEGHSVGRKVMEGSEDKRDYRVYWEESDKAIKEFKSIKVPFSYAENK